MSRALLSIAVATLLGACNWSPQLAPLASGTGGSSSGGNTTGSGAAAGAGASSANGGATARGGASANGGAPANGGQANSGGAGGTGTANVVSVVDVAATSCVAAADPGVLVVDSGPSVPVFDRLGPSATRLYALSRTDQTFFEVGADGSQASAFVGAVLAASGDASGVSVVFGTGTRLFLQRYDAWMAPVGNSVDVAPSGACGAALAPLGDRGVVAWTDAGALRVRLVDPTGTASSDVAIPGAADGVRCWTSAVATDTGVALSWTRVGPDGASKTFWSMVTADGKAAAPVTVFSTASAHELAAMTRTTSGFALAINETGTTSAFVLVRTDGAGVPVNPAYRFLGTGAADDVAARGDQAAITGSLADGREVLRVVEANRTPSGVPSCLDDNPADGSFVGHASLLADATGYTLLARHRNGSAWLERRDAP